MGTGLSVGKCVMVIGQVIAACRCHCLQLVVRQTVAEVFTGGRKGIVEIIITSSSRGYGESRICWTTLITAHIFRTAVMQIDSFPR